MIHIRSSVFSKMEVMNWDCCSFSSDSHRTDLTICLTKKLIEPHNKENEQECRKCNKVSELG